MWGGLLNRLNMLVTEKDGQPPSRLQTAEAPAPRMTEPQPMPPIRSERGTPGKLSIFGDMRPPTTNSTTANGHSSLNELGGGKPGLPSTALAPHKAQPIPRGRPTVFGLESALTDQQLRGFNFDLFKRLNEPFTPLDLNPTDQVTVNVKAIEQFMRVVTELTSILAIHRRLPPTLPPLQPAALEPFKQRKDENVLALFFLQRAASLDRQGVLKHQFDVENELFQLKSAVEVEMVRDAPAKLSQIDRYSTAAYATLDCAQDLISRVRKARYCLMEIRKNGADIEAIRRKIRRKQQLEAVLSVYAKLQERFRKFNLMMGQKFSVERACNIYNNLVIALVYCHKKLAGGLNLVMLQVFQHRLEDRLLYIRHKLNQNFIFELRMYKSCREKFSRRDLIEVVRQMVSIEEAAKSLLSHPHTQAKEVIEMLRKDESLLRGHFRDTRDEQDVFTDPEVKVMVVAIYKELLIDGGRQLRVAKPQPPATPNN